MAQIPVFLSIVLTTRNQAAQLQPLLAKITQIVSALAADYEIIIVDNASEDATLPLLKNLTAVNGLPNLQIFSLTNRVDEDTAAWVGVENALGDFVAIIDPTRDDISLLPTLLETATSSGSDVVFAQNVQKPPQSLAYRLVYASFRLLYRWLVGIDLSKEAPQYRLISRRLANFMLQQHAAPILHRHLPARSGFSKTTITYESQVPHQSQRKRLKGSLERGIRLFISASQAPMRLVTLLSLFGAGANLIYSIYVIAIMIWKSNVTPGWVTLSLQQAGMFFLISLVLLILSEYILHIVRTPGQPTYHIAQEFTSHVISRRLKLNIEENVQCTTPL